MDIETTPESVAGRAHQAALDLPLSLKTKPQPLSRKGEELASIPNDRVALCWTELAISPQWRLDKLQPTLHIVDDPHHRCVAIAVDKRWLCGSNGALALFATDVAASRFLRMLHLPNPRRGGKRRVEAKRDPVHQCFTLECEALTLCTRCSTQAKPVGFGDTGDSDWPLTEGEF
jgi:hypothetical protein